VSTHSRLEFEWIWDAFLTIFHNCTVSAIDCRSMASSGSLQMRARKPALRALQRQALAKQQAEQQQLRQKSALDSHKPASSSHARHALTAVSPLQSYHVSIIISWYLKKFICLLCCYLCQGGYVSARLCLFVCLFVCLCVSKITQKVLKGSFWNFVGMPWMAKTTIDSILRVIWKESWILDHFEIFVTIAFNGA